MVPLRSKPVKRWKALNLNSSPRRPREYREARSTGEVVEDAAGAGEIGEEFFFGAEFGGMGEEAAAGAARGMFDVEHLVVEDVLDGDLWDGGMIHASI